jgi:acetylornithine deacetylase/succinyl-diaminopimelate desuccinylase-like protein
MNDDSGATLRPSAEQLRRRVAEIMDAARDELAALVRIPSVAFAGFPEEPVRRAAAAVLDLVRGVGIDARLVDVPGSPPAVFGERPARPGAPTVLLYAHYDVQPAGPDAAWASPAFEPVERDGRLFGRGAADDKAGVVMHVAALRALGADCTVGVKVLIEGAEEVGGGGIEEFVAANAAALAADAIVVADAGNAALGEPTLTTSLRGMAKLLVTVTTLSAPVHSGSYGGPAPDALVALVRLLASLHSPAGDVAVEGLIADAYDGAAEDELAFRGDAGVLAGVDLPGTGSLAERLYVRPAITIIGLDAPAVEGAANAVVPTARAMVSVRLAPGQDPARAKAAVTAHLRALAPWNVRLEIADAGGGEGFLARTDGPAYAAATRALGLAFGRPVVRCGQGGSIPLVAAFRRAVPGAEIILWGPEEPRSRIHGPDESVDVDELARCVLAETLFLADLSRD